MFLFIDSLLLNILRKVQLLASSPYLEWQIIVLIQLAMKIVQQL